MCGFLVLTDQRHSREKLVKGLEALAHRGPDGRGVRAIDNGQLQFGHVRLALNGISNGTQPLVNETGQVVAVVNGEFYGWQTQRRELERRGHIFATDSDSEVLIHLYEEHGVDAVKQLRGEFAFVLYDQRRELLVSARDRFGVKPLVWATDSSGSVAFASEAKALFAAQAVTPAWNLSALNHCVHHQYPLASQTLFEGVNQLPPATLAIVKKVSGQWQSQGITFSRYWSWSDMNEGDTLSSEGFSDREQVRKALEESVQLRADAEVPVATYLSGGLDSSLITAMAARTHKAVMSFGVSFVDGGGYNERSFAEQVAAHVGVGYESVEVTPVGVIEALDDAVAKSEGLCVNGHLPAKFLLSKRVRECGFKAVLTGEGADELFFGYPHFQQDLLALEGESEVWHETRKVANDNALLAGVMVAGAGEHREFSATISQQWREKVGRLPAFMTAKYAMGSRVRSFLKASARGSIDERALVAAQLDDLTDDLRGVTSTLRRASLAWSRWTLAGYILRTLGDGTEMAHSIEGRTPFLDCRVASVAARLPLDRLLHREPSTEGMQSAAWVEKKILKEVATEYLPEAICKRRKHPFLSPPLMSDPAARRSIVERLFAAEATVPHFDFQRLAKEVSAAETATGEWQRKLEPVVMMALSVDALHRRFDLS